MCDLQAGFVHVDEMPCPARSPAPRAPARDNRFHPVSPSLESSDLTSLEAFEIHHRKKRDIPFP